MTKMNLLEMTQDILSDMSSDAVNSISDTEESEQVAQIISTTYRLILSERNWPHTRKLRRLTPLTDSNLPTHMTVEDDVKEISNIYYDKKRQADDRDNFREIFYRYPDDFLFYTNQRNTNDPTVSTITDPTGVSLQILNDQPPSYYTSFDDKVAVFDAYDSDLESTLQADKTQVICYTIPRFTMADNFIPDLPDEGFAQLLEQSKARAQAKLRQFEDTLTILEARNQKQWMARRDWLYNGGIRYDDYGRRVRKFRRNPTFRQEDRNYY